MLIIHESSKIYFHTEPVDMRKAINGLSVMVVESLGKSPQSGDVYIFRNKGASKVKALMWDKNGFILHYKRLERGRFKFQKSVDNDCYEITSDQLSWLLAGLDFMLMDTFKELNYEEYF